MDPTEATLTWRPLAAADLEMLAGWLAEPAVARWWHHNFSLEGVQRDFWASVRGDEPGEDLVVLLDERPIGLRGRGLGSRLIAAAVEDIWTSRPDTPAVLVAVVAANVASWRAVEKAGLTRVAEGPMEPENPVDEPLHYIYRVDRPAVTP